MVPIGSCSIGSEVVLVRAAPNATRFRWGLWVGSRGSWKVKFGVLFRWMFAKGSVGLGTVSLGVGCIAAVLSFANISAEEIPPGGGGALFLASGFILCWFLCIPPGASGLALPSLFAVDSLYEVWLPLMPSLHSVELLCTPVSSIDVSVLKEVAYWACAE